MQQSTTDLGLDGVPQRGGPAGGRGGRLLRRAAALGVGVGVFALVASVVEPRFSPAEPARSGGESRGVRTVSRGLTDAQRLEAQRTLMSRRHPQGWSSLGLIEGREHFVLIHGSPEGPRYTVCSLDGQVLQADLPADEVYRAFPSVDVEGMRLEPAPLPEGPALMSAEPLRPVD